MPSRSCTRGSRSAALSVTASEDARALRQLQPSALARNDVDRLRDAADRGAGRDEGAERGGHAEAGGERRVERGARPPERHFERAGSEAPEPDLPDRMRTRHATGSVDESGAITSSAEVKGVHARAEDGRGVVGGELHDQRLRGGIERRERRQRGGGEIDSGDGPDR